MTWCIEVVRGFLLGLALMSVATGALADRAEPVRLVVAGLTHTHVHWLFESNKREAAFEVVGIAESNRELAARYAEQHGFDLALVRDDLVEVLEATKPDGVVAFGSIREHRAVVEAAAPRGIHVMVEKPLAVSLEDAQGRKLADWTPLRQ